MCASSVHSSLLISRPTPDETYYVFVDGKPGMCGTYQLDVRGNVYGGEPCDPATTAGAFPCYPGEACRESPPGTWRCQIAQCNDGIDNDFDGRIDYQADPGCVNASDDDETDP